MPKPHPQRFPWTEVGLRYQNVFEAFQARELFTSLLLFQVECRNVTGFSRPRSASQTRCEELCECVGVNGFM